MQRPGTVAIVGVGLIGGSIGLAIRARGLADRVVGIGRDAAKLDEAVRLGAIDRAETDPAKGLDGAEIAVICTPVGRIAEEAIRCATLGPPEMIVTDAGSTKREIVEAVDLVESARPHFVGAHPIAGSERQGVAWARADLFDQRPCVLTPGADTPRPVLDRVRAFWSSIGCRIFEMSPAEHDRALAFTSHLPHIVAATLAASVPVDFLPLAAGSYRDGTRVAGSDPALWADIFLANRDDALEALSAFEKSLAEFRDILDSRNSPALMRWWEEARTRRLRLADEPSNRGDR